MPTNWQPSETAFFGSVIAGTGVGGLALIGVLLAACTTEVQAPRSLPRAPARLPPLSPSSPAAWLATSTRPTPRPGSPIPPARAHSAVCWGRMSLSEAQRRIADDWYGLGRALGVLG